MLRMRIILCRANTLNMPCSSSFLYLTLYINIKMIENIGQVHACLFCTNISNPAIRVVLDMFCFDVCFCLFVVFSPARYAFVCRYFTIQCDKSTEKPRPRSLNVKENEDVDDAVEFCKNFDTPTFKFLQIIIFLFISCFCVQWNPCTYEFKY